MNVNLLAVFLAAFSTFMIGGIWYGPLFYKVWMKENNFSEDDLKKRNMGMVFGVSFIFALISSLLLSMFIGRDADFGFAVFASLAAGLGWVACSIGTTYLFEGKSLKLFLINAGYHVVSFLIMGIIFGLLK